MQPERKHKGSGVLGTAFLAGERNPMGSRHTGRRPFAQIVQGQSYFRTCALALWLPGAFSHPIQLRSHALIEASLTCLPLAALLRYFLFSVAHIITPGYLLSLLCVYGPSPLGQRPCQSCSPWCPATQDCARHRINTCQRCDKPNELIVDAKLGCCVLMRPVCRGRAGWFERVKLED